MPASTRAARRHTGSPGAPAIAAGAPVLVAQKSSSKPTVPLTPTW